MLLSTFIMKRIISYISLALLTLFSFAQQNLILNGDFEEQLIEPIDFLPQSDPNMSFFIDDIIPHWTAPTNGTPDVFLIKNPSILGDAVGYPIDWNKYGGRFPNIEEVNPFKGSGFVGFVTVINNKNGDNRIGTEYVQTNFYDVLTTHKKYKVKLNYRLSKSSSSSYAQVGIHFSKDSISNHYPWGSSEYPYISRFVPPIREYTNVPIGDTTWQEFKYEFRPSQNFEYLTIGCFNVEYHPFINDTLIFSYYFIDDVSLVEIPCLVGKDTACENEQITYYSTFAGPFEWWHEGNLVSTDSIFTFKAQKGWYYLKTPYGEDSLYLTVLDAMEGLEDVSDTICAGDNVEVNLPAKFSYQWQDGNRSSARIFTDPISQYVELSDGYCVDTIDVSVSWYIQDTDYGIDSFTFCKDSVPNVDYSLAEGGVSYRWGDGIDGRYRFFDRGGTYFYTVIDSNGCEYAGEVIIEQLCVAKYWIPNAFAPDGVNRTFRPFLEDVAQVKLVIYNRWGEKLYENTELHPEWDGTYNGKLSQSGMYYYMLSFRGKSDNVAKNINGIIHLMR
jgi:gliding motility-associated-like protein